MDIIAIRLALRKAILEIQIHPRGEENLNDDIPIIGQTPDVPIPDPSRIAISYVSESGLFYIRDAALRVRHLRKNTLNSNRISRGVDVRGDSEYRTLTVFLALWFIARSLYLYRQGFSTTHYFRVSIISTYCEICADYRCGSA